MARRIASRGRKVALAAAMATLGGVVIAGPAQAADPTASMTCPDPGASTQPFKKWLDIAKYVLSPGASMEGSMSGWTLSGGAKVVSGNESFYVRSGSDRRSLALPAGSSVTSAPMCVGLLYPTYRFFARNTGSPLATLKVEVRGVGLVGAVHSQLPTYVKAGQFWAPTLPLLVLSNVDALLTRNGTTPISFRFTPVGGNWQIDDVYVDPYRSR